MPNRFRTIWISDVHLGTRSANAEAVLDFLDTHEADRYYLVGDIVDGWALRRSWYWPSSHSDLIQALLTRAEQADTVYIPGNHDRVARHLCGLQFGPITLRRRAVHRTADGRQLLVLHGDEFDGVVRRMPWLSKLGGWLYQRLRTVSRHANRVRGWMDKPPWSLAATAKTATKSALQYTANFDASIVRRAQQTGADGVVCGHIHRPGIRRIEGITYANSGDWVEHCTALAEHLDGRLELLRWTPSDRRARHEERCRREMGKGGEQLHEGLQSGDAASPSEAG